jgi:hypothetical protein
MTIVYFSGFSGIYDVDHFIKSLSNDVEIVPTLPSFWMVGNKKKKLKPFQVSHLCREVLNLKANLGDA